MGSSRSGAPRSRSSLPETTSAPPRSSARTESSVAGESSRRSSRSGGKDASNRIVRRTTSIWMSSRSGAGNPAQYSAKRSSFSTVRSTDSSAAVWGSRGSRAPTTTSIARCCRTPVALARPCSNGGASPAILEEKVPSHRPRSFNFSLPSQSASGRSRLRAAPSIRSRSRCARSAGNTGRSPVPISCWRVRRCGSVSCMRACYAAPPTCPGRRGDPARGRR